jgi:NDP-sugar pyrophosphorylase family protein
LPKPLMPVGDYSILEIIIRQLAQYGVTDITLAVNHQAELLRSYVGDGSRWNVKVDLSLEETALGTMGPLRLLRDLPENFIVMNGDVLSDLDYRGLYDEHVASGALFTIASKVREQLVDYGVLETNGGRELAGFKEKPKLTYEVSMGVYVVNRKIVDLIPANRPYGFDNLMLDLIAAHKKVNVRRHDGYWLDIGRPDDYMQAIDEFPQMKSRLLFE